MRKVSGKIDNTEANANGDSDTGTDHTAIPPEPKPREIGGREGPDPTRYGDWEKAGRCIDF